jgi:hypothetical protein
MGAVLWAIVLARVSTCKRIGWSMRRIFLRRHYLWHHYQQPLLRRQSGAGEWQPHLVRAQSEAGQRGFHRDRVALLEQHRVQRIEQVAQHGKPPEIPIVPGTVQQRTQRRRHVGGDRDAADPAHGR